MEFLTGYVLGCLMAGQGVFAEGSACESNLDTQKECGDLDSNDNPDEDEFERKFGLQKVTGPIEKD